MAAAEEREEHEEGHEGRHAGEEGHGKPKTAKDKLKGKEVHIAVIVGILGLILTWILFKRSSSSTAAATTASAAYAAGQSQGAEAAGQATSTSDYQALAGALNAYQATSEKSQQALYTALQTEINSNQAANAAALTGLKGYFTTILATLKNAQGSSGGVANTPASTTSDASSPPPLSAALQSQLAANGESIIQAVKDSAQGYLYLTNKGGVYTQTGAPFYGSYLSLPTSMQVQTAAPTQLTSGAGGSYTEVFGSGATYTFGPTADWASGSPTSV